MIVPPFNSSPFNTFSRTTHHLISSFSPKSILVLCEGNHCRSPIAEGLLKAELGSEIRVESAGLGAQEGHAPHPEAIRLMAERGIDISAFRSRQVTPAMALAADLVLVMDRTQKEWCETLVPSARGRVFLLGCWLPPGQQEIEDPYRQPSEAFPIAFQVMLQSVAAWRNHLNTTPRTK
jgi:protein-tyrosine phosphatase